MKIFCIDIGGTGVKYCTFKDGVQGDIKSVPTPKIMSIDSMSEVVFSLIDAEEGVDFVSISTAGQIRDNTVVESSSKPKYIGCNWRKIIKDRYGIDAVANNDLHAAVMGEYNFGLKEKPENFVTIAVGTGINIGVVINRKIFTGDSNLSSYFDHVTDLGGNTNFREASTKSMLDLYADRSGRNVTGERFISLLKEKDVIATDVYDLWITKLAHFIRNVVYIFEIRTISICGGILNAPYGIYEDIKKKYDEITAPAYKDITLIKSELSSSQLFGAYAYALEELKDK